MGRTRGRTGVSRTAGYDSSQRASTEVGGRVELDAAFALVAAAGHLGGCFFGCHCATLLDWSLVELEQSREDGIKGVAGINGLHKKRLGDTFVVKAAMIRRRNRLQRRLQR